MSTESLFIEPTPRPRAVPQPPRQLGPCQWIVDEKTNKECGDPGESKIRVDTRDVPAMIVLCSTHKARNNERHAARRATRKAS